MDDDPDPQGPRAGARDAPRREERGQSSLREGMRRAVEGLTRACAACQLGLRPPSDFLDVWQAAGNCRALASDSPYSFLRSITNAPDGASEQRAAGTGRSWPHHHTATACRQLGTHPTATRPRSGAAGTHSTACRKQARPRNALACLCAGDGGNSLSPPSMFTEAPRPNTVQRRAVPNSRLRLAHNEAMRTRCM